uniref:WxxW domain-containing protein n=1 Tax=Panagrellus redivivus TaxID=6233 RepID=A0A7E4VEW1_PANRE
MFGRILLVTSAIVGLTAGSYCGQSGIPFSFEAGVDGQPVLGCARPSCFGWDAQGKRAADTAQFYKINKKPDGFLRQTDTKGPVVANASLFQPQYSYCDRSYQWEQCAGANQWVGGIAPLGSIDASSAYRVMCCTYDKLNNAVDQGIAEVRAGQAVVGGEVNGDDGRQTSFEYVANVQRRFDATGAVVYYVSMKRFTCLPEPSQTETGIEQGTVEALVENIAKDAPANVAGSTYDATAQQQQPQQPQYQLLPNGQIVPVPCENDTATATAAPAVLPFGLPLLSQQSPYQTPDATATQQQANVYQPSMFDPLGIFSPRAYAAPTATYNTPQVQQPQGLWPFQSYYDYSQNPAATYGAQTYQAAQPVATVAGTQNVPAPKPLPLTIPTVEQVENAVSPTTRLLMTL